MSGWGGGVAAQWQQGARRPGSDGARPGREIAQKRRKPFGSAAPACRRSSLAGRGRRRSDPPSVARHRGNMSRPRFCARPSRSLPRLSRESPAFAPDRGTGGSIERRGQTSFRTVADEMCSRPRRRRFAACRRDGIDRLSRQASAPTPVVATKPRLSPARAGRSPARI